MVNTKKKVFGDGVFTGQWIKSVHIPNLPRERRLPPPSLLEKNSLFSDSPNEAINVKITTY
jgi:hypothetical protein